MLVQERPLAEKKSQLLPKCEVECGNDNKIRGTRGRHLSKTRNPRDVNFSKQSYVAVAPEMYQSANAARVRYQFSQPCCQVH